MEKLEAFKNAMKCKSKNTIKAYITQYNKLSKLVGKDIANTSQKKILEIIKDIDNSNSRQALLNIAILIRTNNKLDTKELLDNREKIKTEIKSTHKEKNKELQETLPTYQDLLDYLEVLRSKLNYRDYIINYLLINFNVRNEDLLFQIVSRKRDTKDTNFNYIWVSPTKATYIRNVYKTAKTYGQKVNVITDKPFMSAIRQIVKHGDIDFIPNPDQLGYYIRNATLLGIGEGKYNKIIVNHFRSNIDKLKEISNNRGTNINTILESYDIEDTE